MDESLEYEKMIEIPLASCEYVHKRRHRLLKKRKLIKQINQKIAAPYAPECADCAESSDCAHFADNGDFYGNQTERCLGLGGGAYSQVDYSKKGDYSQADYARGDEQADCARGDEQFFNAESESKKGVLGFFKGLKKQKSGQDRVIAVQIAAAFLLVAAIILTNVFWENSGMNVLFKSVFGVSQKQTDNRVYSDFSLNLPVRGEGLTYTEGVINVNGESFIYPVCDGTISQIQKGENGKYTVTVTHSDSFKSVIEGADFVCFNAGETVNAKIPLCHTEGGASIYLYDNYSLLTQYAAKENSIVWTK